MRSARNAVSSRPAYAPSASIPRSRMVTLATPAPRRSSEMAWAWEKVVSGRSVW